MSNELRFLCHRVQRPSSLDLGLWGIVFTYVNAVKAEHGKSCRSLHCACSSRACKLEQPACGSSFTNVCSRKSFCRVLYIIIIVVSIIIIIVIIIRLGLTTSNKSLLDLTGRGMGSMAGG